MKRLRPLTFFASALVIGVLLGTILRPLLLGLTRSKQSLAHAETRAVSNAMDSILNRRLAGQSEAAAAIPKGSAMDRYLWLVSQAEGAALHEFARLLVMANREGHRDVKRAIATRWASTDASHMFKALMANEADGRSDYTLWKILFKEWVSDDPQGALAEFAADRDAQHDSTLRLLFLSDLIAQAPQVAVAAASQLEFTDGFRFNLEKVGEWAAADPEAAAASVVEHMKDNSTAWEIMKEIGRAWGNSDARAALKYAESLKNGFGTVLSRNAIRAWAELNPEAATAFASAESDPAKRAHLGEGLAAGLAKTEPEVALSWAQNNLRSVSRAEAIGDIVRTVAKEDISTAGDLVANMDPGGAMNRAVSSFLSVWGRTADLSENNAILAWIDNLTDSEARQHAIRTMAWRLTTYDKNGLIDFVSGEFGHLATDDMLRRAAAQRARQDPESAAAWANSLPQDRSDKALAIVHDTQKSN